MPFSTLGAYRIALLCVGGFLFSVFFNWKDPTLTGSVSGLLVYWALGTFCAPAAAPRPTATATLYELQALFSDFGNFRSLLFRCLAKMLFERAMVDEGEIEALELAAERI